MPLADILRSRGQTLSDPALSGAIPSEWRHAKEDLQHALDAADRAGVAGDRTQIASGFGPGAQQAASRDLGFDAIPARREAKGGGSLVGAGVPGAAAASSGRDRARGRDAHGTEPGVDVTRISGRGTQQRGADRPAFPIVPDTPQRADAMPAGYAAPAAQPGVAGDSAPGGRVKERNQVIAMFACKGGCGATALAVNVAHTYARDKLGCCLVDLDLQLGDALASLALRPKMTLAEAAIAAASGGPMATNRLPTHDSSLAVLSQVGSLDDVDSISGEAITKLVEGLRQAFDVVVLDGLRDFNENVLAVLDVADRICLVCVQEVLAVRRARWAFNILRKIGFGPKDITLVLNRYDARAEVPLASVKAMFAPASIITVVSEPIPVLHALNRGVPLQQASPNQPVTREVIRLAYHLSGAETADDLVMEHAAKPSFMQRMLRKFG